MSSNNHPQEVPKEEEEILQYFLEVRSFLSKMKQNRSQFLNSKDVMESYQKVLTKVRELDELRKNSHATPSNSATTLIHSAELHNRVDSVIDDLFQLLSLSFLTVGLKNSAPATYASLSTVQSLLEHLNESNVYTHHDLRPIKERLDEVSAIVEQNKYDTEASAAAASASSAYVDPDVEDPELEEYALKKDEELNKNKIEEDLLLRAKLQHCIDEYHVIESKLEEIHPDLQSCMETLFQIRRGLLSLASSTKRQDSASEVKAEAESKSKSKSKPSSSSQSHHILPEDVVDSKLKELKERLEKLEAHRDSNGKFKSLETDKVEEKGQNVLNGLLDDCHDLINDLSHQKDGGISLDTKLQPIYDQLVDIKTTLENLLVTRRWTLRETDLFTYQKKLGEIDNLRVNGKFPTDHPDSKGQSILLYLLRRCYAIIYKLLESSEPVSESLQRVHNQLSTVRRCLLELKRMGGVDNDRELYPYQMKLASLDNMRTDGIFYDSDGNIPEGQGTLNALLAECFDIIHELKIEAEERAEESLDINENGDESVEMTKDPTMRDVQEQPTARYMDVYAHDEDDEDDEAEDTNFSEHSYEDEEYTTTSYAED